jgi:hypothetical protein
VALGQGDEEITGADDLIDLGDTFCAVGQRGDALSAADAIDLGDAQLVAGGEDGRIVRAELCRWGDDGNFLDASGLRGYGGHQYGRGISSGAAGNADADALQREVALAKQDAGARNLDITVQDGPLELQDVALNAADRGEELRIGRGVGCGQFFG